MVRHPHRLQQVGDRLPVQSGAVRMQAQFHRPLRDSYSFSLLLSAWFLVVRYFRP